MAQFDKMAQTIIQVLMINVLVTDMAYSPGDRKGKRKIDEVKDTYIDTDADDEIKIIESWPMIIALLEENQRLEQSIKNGIASSSHLNPTKKEKCIADILTVFEKRDDFDSCFEFAFMVLIENEIIIREDAKGYFNYLLSLVKPGNALDPTKFCSQFGFSDEQRNIIESHFGDNRTGAVENVFRFGSVSTYGKEDFRIIYMQHVFECCIVEGVKRSPKEYCTFVYND